MGRLYVKCKQCGELFDSGIGGSLQGRRIFNIRFQCPNGHYAVYNIPDLIDEDSIVAEGKKQP